MISDMIYVMMICDMIWYGTLCDMIYDIYVNCNWIDTQLAAVQYTFTHRQ